MAKRVIHTAELTNGGALPLHDCLARLGFSGYEPRIEQTLRECEEKDVMLPRQVLTETLNDIIAARDEQKAMMRTKMARFPVTTQTIETFDFSRLPDKLIELKIREFAGCDWVRSHSNLFLCGNPGLGKTHLSIALGIRATQKAYSTLFIPAKDLFAELNAARQDSTYERKLKTIQRNEVLIIDDLSSAIAPSPENAMIFYDLLDGRQNRKSTIITSNRTILDWIQIIGGDPTCLRAASDRFLDSCHVIRLKGKSYRLRRFTERQQEDWGSNTPQDDKQTKELLNELTEALD